MKFRKIIAGMISMAVIASMAGCGSKKEDNSSRQGDGIGGHMTFTVGFDAEFPPYGYQDDNGEYVGFDLALAQEVCDRNNWELIKQPIDWDSKDMELESGTIDCIWNGFTINGREDDYTWTTPYIDNSQVVVVRTDSGIDKLEDLKDKVVVVQSDSSALHAFEGDDAEESNKQLAAAFAELQQVGDYNSAFLNLDSGAADAICLDYGVAVYEVKNRGDEFKILDENVSTERYGVGFLKGNTAIRDLVQETLDEMYNDGTLFKIADEWADKGIEKSSICFDPADELDLAAAKSEVPETDTVTAE